MNYHHLSNITNLQKTQKKATNLQMFWESCIVLATYMMNTLSKNGYFQLFFSLKMWRLLCMFFPPPIKTLCTIGNEFFCVAAVRKLVGKKKTPATNRHVCLATETERWRWDAEGNRKG
jgi:hypothetical protein